MALKTVSVDIFSINFEYDMDARIL